MPDGTTKPARFAATARAAAEIASIATREGRGGAGLRISVNAGGCSGFAYNFALEDNATEDDLVIEREGVRVFVDSVSLDLLEGAELDWNDSLIGAHFVVRNPQAVSGCGCGTSFAVA